MIGCGALFLIVIGGLALVLYNLIQNPSGLSQLSSVGLSPTTTKSLLQTFSVIFFGLIVFLGIAVLITNLYRIITVKNKSKIRYGFGIILGLFLFVLAIGLGAKINTLITNLSLENILDSNQLVMPYLQTKSWPVYTRLDPTLKLIAPSIMTYKLNTQYFNSNILPSLWQVNFSSIDLDCWNGTKLLLDMTTYTFKGSCIYFNKWSYTLTFDMEYINIATSEKVLKSFTAGTMDFLSEITISPNKWKMTFNDAKTEMIVGKNPIKVTFDAGAVFKDLWLTSYKIIWDFNGDGQMDKQDVSSTTFVYNDAQLYNIYIRFPNLNNYIYTFPVRVEQSDVPVCKIAITPNTDKTYAVNTTFADTKVNITSYQFDILDRQNNDKILDSIKSKSATFNYQFPGIGLYAIQANFITDGDKQGQCESDDLQIGSSDFKINYSINFKSPQSPSFQLSTEKSEVSLSGTTLTLIEIPTMLQVKINQIIPNDPAATTKVLFDGVQVISTDPTLAEITVDTATDHVISIVVENKATWAKTQQDITVVVNRADIIGKIIVKPDTVGTDPFTVKFDASTTTLNDSTDEIVYFSRNFWDGTIKKNLSESVISHTYTYDTVKDNGEYHVTLTIQTKKWRTLTISPANNIIVKRENQTLKINIDSNPAQIANVGDRVSFSLEINGLPTEINRDFWNWKTLVCKQRECIQATQIYDTPGTYTVKAEVTYPDKPSIDWTIALKIK